MEKDKDLLIAALAARTQKWRPYPGSQQIEVTKWTLRRGVEHSGRLTSILLKIARTGGNLGLILSMDVNKFIEESKGDAEILFEIASDTIKASNPQTFKTSETSLEYIEALALDEFADLLILILRQNIRPLVARLGELKKVGVLPGLKAQDQEEALKPTS